MAIREIVKYGNPILKRKMPNVKNFENLQPVIRDMFDTMYENEGIGLAANQVGLQMNLLVLDITHLEELTEPMVCINGSILTKEGEAIMEEGCLSIPEVRVNVPRAEKIVFTYSDEKGESYKRNFEGMLARVIQHEVDHLNGVLIIDRANPLDITKHKKTLKSIAQTSK